MTYEFDVDLAARLSGLANAVPVTPPGLVHVDPSPIRSGSTTRRLAPRGFVPLVAVVVAASAIAVLAGLGPLAGVVANGPVSSTVAEGPFELTIRSAKARYEAGELVDIEASITYLGPEASIRVRDNLGNGFGADGLVHTRLVKFGVEEPIPVEGVGHMNLTGFGSRLMCDSDDMVRGEPKVYSFAKSGNPIDNANAAWFAEPLRLPQGTWHPYANASVSVGDCNGAVVNLKASIVIEVDGPTATRLDRTATEAAPTSTGNPGPTTSIGADIHLATGGRPTVVNGQTVCEMALGGGVLALQDDTGLGVADAFGIARPIVWPAGYTARFEDGRAVLIDASGQVVAREGDRVQFGGGLNVDGTFGVCGGVQVIATPPQPTIGSTPTTTPPVITPGPIFHGGPAVDTVATDGTFVVRVSTDEGTFRADERIDVHIELTYVGPEPSVVLWSADPAVFNSIEQLDGPHAARGGASDVCMSTPLKRNVAQGFAFTKSIGFSADDPDIDWIRAYIDDPDLHLSPGTWHITASFEGFVGDCGGELHRLHADIVIHVVD